MNGQFAKSREQLYAEMIPDPTNWLEAARPPPSAYFPCVKFVYAYQKVVQELEQPPIEGFVP